MSIQGVIMRLKPVGVVALVTGLVATPGVANAASVEYSYSGADYTYNGTNGYAIWACDREADNHAVKGQYYKTSTTSQLVEFTNNKGSGTCYYANSTTAPIYRHRVVEVVPFAVDDYGLWVYPR